VTQIATAEGAIDNARDCTYTIPTASEGTDAVSTVRERIEERERHWLVPVATFSHAARRPRNEAPSELRTEFQRDRDRIIHSNAFRRLKYKTQVFLPPSGDHVRTRLTHTLEVTQVARTIARALGLNEDLTEAIGLGHDLGHTPSGHAGERALAGVFPGFRHNEQSLRVVDLLEKDGQGLNLTDATRDGILHHSKPVDSMAGTISASPSSPEGQVVKLSDSIAYINHDLDDAIRGGLLTASMVPAIITERVGSTHSQRINALVSDVVATSAPRLGCTAFQPADISLSSDMLETANMLRSFLFQVVYEPINRLPSTRHAEHIVEHLFEMYCRAPDRLPADVPSFPSDSVERHVADVVSGMTDRFAHRCYAEGFHPVVEEL